MQRLLSWSGGKDAAWTLRVMRGRGDDVVALLTTITDVHDRVSMQGIRREVLHAQAQAVGLPVIEVRIPPQCDNATYEAAFADGLMHARSRWPGLDTIAFGDLLLADVRAWRESLCARLGWRIETPLFGGDTAELAREMQRGGLCARVCCVDTQQLDARFAGRAFDADFIAELPEGCDPCGENGEFHTLVHDGPMFREPLGVREGETVLRENRFAYTDFAPA